MHFGRPTPEQCEAYTRVLQGHVSRSVHSLTAPVLIHAPQIAIDTAVFPEGTSGQQLDVLARKALWKEGMNYPVSDLI